MAESTIWWLLAGVAVAVELATGTFYLLMAALGLAAGALAAHAGAGLGLQLLATAVVGTAGIGALAWHRKRQPAGPAAAADPNVNLDVGETVTVEQWQPDGTAQVRYRGAQWSVTLAAGGIATPGQFRVREVVGNRLVVGQP